MRSLWTPAPTLGALLLVLSGAAAGCSDHAHEEQEAAGWEELPQLTVDTVAEVGGSAATGPAALGSVRDAIILEGAPRVAVAEGQSQEIRVFDGQDGRHVLSFGGVGEGPGEFTGLQRLASLADGGVAAWDRIQNRLTTAGPDGDVRSVAAAASPGLSGRQPSFVGVFPDGRYILRFQRSERQLRGSPDGLWADTIPFLLYAPSGELADTLAVAPAPARYLYDRGAVWGTEDLIFGRKLVGAVGLDHLLLAWDDLTYASAYSPGGHPCDLPTFPLAPRPVSSERIEAERARRVDAVASSTPRVWDSRGVETTDAIARDRRSVIEALDTHFSTPAFDLLVVGGQGSMWIRRFPFPDEETTTWIVLSSSGEPEGRLTLPIDDQIIAARADWLVLLSHDDLGSPIVRLVRALANPEGRAGGSPP